jgi:hypothetical protein
MAHAIEATRPVATWEDRHPERSDDELRDRLTVERDHVGHFRIVSSGSAAGRPRDRRAS